MGEIIAFASMSTDEVEVAYNSNISLICITISLAWLNAACLRVIFQMGKRDKVISPLAQYLYWLLLLIQGVLIIIHLSWSIWTIDVNCLWIAIFLFSLIIFGI